MRNTGRKRGGREIGWNREMRRWIVRKRKKRRKMRRGKEVEEGDEERQMRSWIVREKEKEWKKEMRRGR